MAQETITQYEVRVQYAGHNSTARFVETTPDRAKALAETLFNLVSTSKVWINEVKITNLYVRIK